ncbi:MAG: polymer-forming cytoskeletal protein [Akkermansiaceae bacterium]|jgi:cytoskeletal protein CcmA (bactofilin family)|nr:polymer-forming cytoskeletal protein [Akkermansiaceae bacterium]
MSNNIFQRVIGRDQQDPGLQPPVAPPPAAQPVPLPGQAAPAPAAARPVVTGSRNILSTDVEVKGTIRFTGELVVDGKIEGEVSSDGNLTIGENARFRAQIRTATVVVYGKVEGNITATDRVDLKASAEVVGDIKAKVLTIEAGAVFIGKSTVGNSAQAPAEAAPAKPPGTTPAAPPAKPPGATPPAQAATPAAAAPAPATQAAPASNQPAPQKKG